MLVFLIICNILIYLAFVFGIFLSPFIADCVHSLALSHNSRFYTIFSYAFLHESFGHLFFNCASLYMFARLLSPIQLKEWLCVYFLGAAFSGLCFLAIEPNAELLGASGAISALIGYCALKLKQPSLLIVFVALNLIGAALDGGDIAFSAHIAGLFWGAISFLLLHFARI